ncbi:MAG: hypothetical protein F7C07_08145 [Desulfurococcales archaeon]|nr:hypothetical protein [Desulfurococcales archaeon]
MAARPVFGQGVYYVTSRGTIFHTVIYEYYDEEEEYYSLLKSGHHRGEERRLKKTMQELLSNDRVVVNGKQVTPQVIDARIETRGYKNLSSTTFHIVMNYEPLEGRNVLEVFYAPVKTEYGYVIDWVLDECMEIIEVETDGIVESSKKTARVRVKRGERLKGYESLVFKIGKCRKTGETATSQMS